LSRFTLFANPCLCFIALFAAFGLCILALAAGPPSLTMARIKQTLHMSDDGAQPEGVDTTTDAVAEVLLALNKDSLEDVESWSREGSEVDVEDRCDESGS
jgi:hypothetical protein